VAKQLYKKCPLADYPETDLNYFINKYRFEKEFKNIGEFENQNSLFLEAYFYFDSIIDKYIKYVIDKKAK